MALGQPGGISGHLELRYEKYAFTATARQNAKAGNSERSSSLYEGVIISPHILLRSKPFIALGHLPGISGHLAIGSEKSGSTV